MARRPLILAAISAALAAAIYVAVVNVPAIATADLRTYVGFLGLQSLPGASLGDDFAGFFDPVPFAVMTFGIAVCGALTGRTRAGLLAAGAMVAANVTTQILKPLLAVDRGFLPSEAWPSGHTTAVMSLALALTIVAPPRLRALAAAVGGLMTVIVTFSIMMLGWHYPSDVAGGLLIATFWACLAVIPLRGEERPGLRAPVVAGVVLSGIAALIVATRPGAAVDYAMANTTFVLGALAIAAGALALSGSVPASTAAQPGRRPGSPRARG